MDVTSVDEVLMCADPRQWRQGDSWLAGGTVLYSYGTDITRGAPTRLLDITGAGWPPLTWHHPPSSRPYERTPEGPLTGTTREVEGVPALEIAATCRIAELRALADEPFPGGVPRATLPGLALIPPACDAFVASWKIWNVSTVGGNVATGLPAGPMISLLSGWDATAVILCPDGTERRTPVAELVVGPARTRLADGELIRSFLVPGDALAQTPAFRRISLTERGRSAALLIGRRTSASSLRLTVTASTFHPILLDVTADPGAVAAAGAAGAAVRTGRTTPARTVRADGAAWRDAIDAAVARTRGWYDDIHGEPAWRRLMTHRLGEEILAELLPESATGIDDAIGRVTGDLRIERSTL
ncbi:MAG: FAD binding domain-containing protein [Microbacterium sp.]|jgi:CO/xanthine dehydrogenase FAD-binding subunit|uniref:FAD binding domain-containing protein n=1 Tax=Microbacterium sp. TaxID=51671 RepID=UPI00282974C0|nr:FAD binding domain-containing protein [Microbacterium sp.]MDR2322399.1 FAD binding domain-containing protein [Microbacterium sp.]